MNLMQYVEKKQKEYKTIANFSEPYFKLFVDTGEILTTIRSKNYNKKHQMYIGDIGWILLDRHKLRLVKILGWEDKKISEMELKFLQKDANYPGHPVSSHQEFVDLLNYFSIQACGFGNNSINTVKRIFTLKAISEPLIIPKNIAKAKCQNNREMVK